MSKAILINGRDGVRTIARISAVNVEDLIRV